MEESKEKVSMSEEKGKISVIVPVYQAEKYLAKALDSVISQDYENWELFLLVRKSSDQSEKIARDYEKKYDSIHMIERGENKAGEARNQGLEKAQGEYVLFLDSDDYLPDASVMQRYVRMAEQTNADIVVANYARLWNGKMLPAVSHASFSRYHRDSQEFQFRGFFSAGTLSYVWGKLYRRSFLEKNQIRFAKYDYAEDKFFNMQCYLCRAKYIFFSRIGYLYRKNETSISSRYRANSSECWIAMARDLKEWMSDHEIQMESCEELVWYLIFFATFFDAKMEYEEHKKKLRFIWKTLRLYGKDEFARECLCRLAADKKIWKLQDKKWVVMTKGFCIGMKLKLYLLLSIGIRSLIRRSIDERLSDTGLREV